MGLRFLSKSGGRWISAEILENPPWGQRSSILAKYPRYGFGKILVGRPLESGTRQCSSVCCFSDLGRSLTVSRIGLRPCTGPACAPLKASFGNCSRGAFLSGLILGPGGGVWRELKSTWFPLRSGHPSGPTRGRSQVVGTPFLLGVAAGWPRLHPSPLEGPSTRPALIRPTGRLEVGG